MTEINNTALSAVAKLVDEILEIDGVKHVKFKCGLIMPLDDEKEADEWVKKWDDLTNAPSHPASGRPDGMVIASNAVYQLIDLMAQPCVNGEWKPDWNDADQEKWCIGYWGNIIEVNCYDQAAQLLAFKDKATAEKFLSMYRSYIEKASPILFGVEL